MFFFGASDEGMGCQGHGGNCPDYDWKVLGHVNATIESNQTGFFCYCSICHVQASQDVKVEYPKTENFNQVFF